MRVRNKCCELHSPRPTLEAGHQIRQGFENVGKIHVHRPKGDCTKLAEDGTLAAVATRAKSCSYFKRSVNLCKSHTVLQSLPPESTLTLTHNHKFNAIWSSIESESEIPKFAYCFDEVSFKMITAGGVDPMMLQPGRQTLHHNLTSPTDSSPNLPGRSGLHEFFDWLGIDINARGDKNISDKDGERPFDLVAIDAPAVTSPYAKRSIDHIDILRAPLGGGI